MPDAVPPNRLKTSPSTISATDPPSASVPSPELLDQYVRIAPELPALVIKEWSHRHQRAFLYALVALIIGGLLALALIAGFVYLIMNNHDTSAGVLLGSGAVSLVTGFLVTRLDRSPEPAAAKKAAKKK